jgi:dTDP-4-dehydrorhamnose reductase
LRALITGAGGQLGSDLTDLLPRAAAFGHRELPVEDAAAVRLAIETSRPEVVFNAAADNAVDAAEADPARAETVNGRGAQSVAVACAELGVRLIHFSTNYVFDGAAPDPYSEDDEPHPLGAYARSKLLGERLVLEALPAALVIRSSGLFGVRGSAVKGGSFPERIVARANLGQPLRVVSDQLLNPTYTRDLAAAAIELAGRRLEGVIHVVAEGCCSYLELAERSLSLAGVQARVEAITSDALAAPAPRPRNGCLVSRHIGPLRPWQDGLADYFAELELTRAEG